MRQSTAFSRWASVFLFAAITVLVFGIWNKADAASIPIQSLVDVAALKNLQLGDYRVTYIPPSTPDNPFFQDNPGDCYRRATIEADGIQDWTGTDKNGNAHPDTRYRWKSEIRLPIAVKKGGHAFRGVGYVQYADTSGEDEGEEGKFSPEEIAMFNKLACDGYGIMFIALVQARDPDDIDKKIGTVSYQLHINENDPDALNFGKIMHAAYQAVCAMPPPLGISELQRDGALGLTENYMRMATLLQRTVEKLYPGTSFSYVPVGGSKWGSTSWYTLVLDDRAVAGRPSGSALINISRPGGIIDRWIHDRYGWDPRAIPFQELGRITRGCLNDRRDEKPGYIDTFDVGNYLDVLKNKDIFFVLSTSDEPNPFGSTALGFKRLRAIGGRYARIDQIDKTHGGKYIIDGKDVKDLAIEKILRVAGGEVSLPQITNAGVGITPVGDNQCRYDIFLDSNLLFDKVRVHTFAGSNTDVPGDDHLYNCDSDSDGTPDVGLCAKTKTFSDFTVSGSRMSKSVTDKCLDQERLWFILEGQKNNPTTGEPDVVISSDLIQIRDWKTKCPHGAIGGPGCLAENPRDNTPEYFASGNACLGVYDGTRACDTLNVASEAISSGEIRLTWNNVAHEEGYEIEQSRDNASFTKVASVGADVTKFTVNNLLASTHYYYRIQAYNADVAELSNTTSNDTLAEGGGGGGGDGGGGGGETGEPPGAPTNLDAQAISENRIRLTWRDQSSNEDGFEIQRSADGVTFTTVGNTSANVIEFDATSLAANTFYYFRVKAFNNAGFSSFSNIAAARTSETSTGGGSQVPDAPTGLSVVTVGDREIALSWIDASDDEDGFTVERGVKGGLFEEVGTVGRGVSAFRDKGLKAATTYYYQVRAFNAVGPSAYSNIVKVETLSPGTPSCGFGSVQASCQCGGTVVGSGYCCNGQPQEKACGACVPNISCGVWSGEECGTRTCSDLNQCSGALNYTESRQCRSAGGGEQPGRGAEPPTASGNTTVYRLLVTLLFVGIGLILVRFIVR